MGRKSIPVNLHGFKIQELKQLRNETTNTFERSILATVILRYEGKDTKYICQDTQKSKPTIVSYIKKWNELGIAALADHRGGSESSFTAEMRDDLINTLETTVPNDHDFIGYKWTTPLLAEYINQKYGISYSDETIRRILKSENYTFKRAQPRPTKAVKTEREVFFKKLEPF